MIKREIGENMKDSLLLLLLTFFLSLHISSAQNVLAKFSVSIPMDPIGRDCDMTPIALLGIKVYFEYFFVLTCEKS